MNAVDPRINSERLMQSFADVGRVGRNRDGGISRVCLTAKEREAHTLLQSWCKAASMNVAIDAFGNTIAIRPGRRPGPAIGMGSHLDSVPNGGNFDGVAGVLTALEVIRALNDDEVLLEHPLKLVIFAAEEGARFGMACLGSRAAFGYLSASDLDTLNDRDGTTLAYALAEMGFDPALVPRRQTWTQDLAVFLELHIEQGRVLEDAGESIGVVDWIAGNRRLRMTLGGQSDHSGATPMSLRRDALLGGAEVALNAEKQARRCHGVVATTGEFTVHPNTLTAVPGRIELGVDVRSADIVLQSRTALRIEEAARATCDERDLSLHVERVSDSTPTMLPVWLQHTLTAASRAITGRSRIMTSGAGHDSQIVARTVPAGMIFIPCRAGISHDPAEYASDDHLIVGTRVLLKSIVDLDHRLANAVNLSSDFAHQQE